MKTSQMIAMLEVNPNLINKFKNKRTGNKMEGSYTIDYLITQEYELIREPVPALEAIKAWVDGKTVKCECEKCSDSPDKCKYEREKDEDPESADSICGQGILAGKWYIENDA